MAKNLKLTKVGMKELLNGSMHHERASGISNKWTTAQRDGIFDPEIYEEHTREFEQLITFKNFAFNFSFNFISTKKIKD